jgi:hypothetical protein
VAENGKLKFFRTRKSVKEIRETSPDMFAKVEAWEIDIPFATAPDGHKVITKTSSPPFARASRCSPRRGRA